MSSIVTATILLTWGMALIALFGAKKAPELSQLIGKVGAGILFALTITIWSGYNQEIGGYQFTELAQWSELYGISYSIGVDGFAATLILLVGFVTFMLSVSPFAIGKLKTEFHAQVMAGLLFAAGALVGCFSALDGFLFYVYWELMLIPLYFVVGMAGGKNRISAALWFVVYTVIGSACMFVALVWLAFKYQEIGGAPSFALEHLAQVKNLTSTQEGLLFFAFLIAFIVKIPVFPFNGWMAETYKEAPIVGTVMLSALLGKAGIYGLVRFVLPLFPCAVLQYAPLVGCIAAFSVVYAALVAWSSGDLKRLLAYSSMSHVGLSVLALFSLHKMAMLGGLFFVISHGIIVLGLFVLAGWIAEHGGSYKISDYGGLITKAPILSATFMILLLASIGLPLTSGFVGEFMSLTGAFQHLPLQSCIALSAVVISAIYMLGLYQELMAGEPRGATLNVPDLNKGALVWVSVVCAFVVILGLMPAPLLNTLQATLGDNSTAPHLISLEQCRFDRGIK